MATQIKLRRDSYQNWFDANPVLAEGEPGYDLTNKKLKIGDGTTLWRVLPYFDDQITDLSSYAGNIVPSVDSTYSLGSPSKRWNDAFLANNSVYIGDIKLSNTSGRLVVQQVTNAGLQTEAPVINPGVVTTDRIINGVNEVVLGSTGVLTLPAAGILESADTATLTVGAELEVLNETYLEQESLWADIRDQDAAEVAPTTRSWEGLPSYEAYDLIMAFNGTPTVSAGLAQRANSAKQAYLTWQTAIDETNVSINVGSNTWIFDATGDLSLPPGNTIRNAMTGDDLLGGGSSSVTTGETAPVSPSVGDLWYDTNSGKIYIYYDSSWVDSNPSSVVATASTGDITFLGTEIRSVNSSVKLVANSDSVNRRVLQLYTDGTVEVPVGAGGTGLVQSAAGLWLSANGSQLKLNPNGAVDLPLVNGTTSLIRTTGHTTINSNGKEWFFNSNGNLTFPDATVQTTAYPGVLVPADGDSTSGTANLVFYDGAWKNTSRVGINPTSGTLTILGVGGQGGIILPNTATISTVDIGFRFISTSNGPGGVAVQENSLTVGIANTTLADAILASPGSFTIDFNGGLNDVAIDTISGPQSGTNVYTITGTWPANTTGFPITITSNDYVAGGITKLNSDNGVNITTAGGSWVFDTDGNLTLPYPGNPGSKIKGGPEGGINSIDLSWELILASGKTIKINPGSGGVVSPTFWSFDSDVVGGGITLPAGSTFLDRNGGVVISGAGQTAVNRFYEKVSNTLYQTIDGGVTYQLVNESGTWSLAVLGEDNPRYTSSDLTTWTAVVGAAPAPAGQLSTRETRLLVDNKAWTFSPDGTTTLPGAVVKSTVAKDGPAPGAVGTRLAATVFADPGYNPLWQSLIEVSVPGFSCTIDFSNGVGNPGFTNIVDNAGNRQVGDILATVLGSVIAPGGNGLAQGQDGVDDLVVKVDTLSEIAVPTALDLTKTINKLADGAYTLADGVEGQIMYLVRQTGSAKDNISINVANARIDGALNTTIDHFPFENVPNVNMSTLIFTDGAWQSDVGGWD